MNSLSDKEICDKYDFNALSYFYTFCKREYGLTPRMIREEDKRTDLLKGGGKLNDKGKI